MVNIFKSSVGRQGHPFAPSFVPDSGAFLFEPNISVTLITVE